MQIDKYLAMKAAGVAIIAKVGPDTVVIAVPKFDQDTGAALPAAIEQHNLVGIDDQIAVVEAQLAALKVLRGDVAAVLAKA